MLSHIHIVLLETTHPGNIGAVARAMKAMGLSRLCLVKPRSFPHADASARASGADDLLARARVVDSLEDAVAECRLVVGTSNRQRTIGLPVLDPRQMSARLAEQQPLSVAILFGPEHSGLSNAQLDRCHWQVSVPTVEHFPSLNIAAAVQLIAYELRMGMLQSSVTSSVEERAPVSMEEMERFYQHLEEVLVAIEFLDPDNPKQLMRRLRRLYNRVQPDSNEMNILRGILSAVQRSITSCR